MMGNDELKFFDEQSNEEIVFNFYTFCEILKGCLVEFCNISKEEANLAIENSNLFKSPIQNVNDVYFFSHEHPYHWAMICYYGESYWEKNQDLLTPPDSYDDWENSFLKENDLKASVYNF
ncbi:MAG: hypothetical protein MI892_04135 [Desulfobacterales bacterium]|nr:hypothetical protein [Desulfobacterales bacterium]